MTSGADRIAQSADWRLFWPAFARALIVLVFLAIYFLSGFSALLYQVIWHRMLAIFSGSDLYATTTIVAAFMAGLGTGSLIGGRLADALSFRWKIALFAFLELVIGVFALISTWWYYDILYVEHATLASSPVILAIVLFCSLLVPTCCMGMSFPLISKALTPSVAMAGRRIGSLYAMNTLGGAVGAFVTVWFWMGALDFPAILRIGAQVNFVVVALALLAGIATWLDHHQRAPVADGDGAGKPSAGQPALGFSSWMWLYALAGFLALSWEIVWFRLLGVILKSNSFTFPHLLAIYLGGLAAGILTGARLVHLGAHPGRVYLALQVGVSLYAGLALVVLFQALEHWSSAAWLQAYLAGFDPLDVSVVQYALNNWWSAPGELWSALAGQSGFLALYILVPCLLVGPPTLLMGASFAFLQRAVQDDRARLGRRVGWLQAANILGATLGSIITGTLLLHVLGTAQTARVLLAIGGVFLLPLLWLLPRGWNALAARLAGPATAAVVTLVLMWSIPAGPRFWALLHGSQEELVISQEDGTGVSVLKNSNADFSGTTMVYVNGLGQSWIPFHDIDGIHSQLGILPIMLHPAPASVAVIGLGSGDTAYNLGGREETTAITSIEIVQPQLETLQLLQARRPYGGLEGLLSDPRYRFVFMDGRSFLARQAASYDVIQADALRPNSAYAGNLYSYEYFMLIRSRLNPGGLTVTWAPTERVRSTFLQVFPHVIQVGSILVGSPDPIRYDPAVLRTRAAQPFSQAHYARAGVDVMALLAPLLEPADLSIFPAAIPRQDLNTDLQPRDEYNR